MKMGTTASRRRYDGLSGSIQRRAGMAAAPPQVLRQPVMLVYGFGPCVAVSSATLGLASLLMNYIGVGVACC